MRGDLTLTSGDTRLDMPALREVKGLLSIKMPAARSVALGALTHVDGGLVLEGAAALSALDLTKLERVGGTLRLDASQLTQLSLPMLGDIGWDFELRSNPLLASVQVPLLQHVGGMVAFSNNPALPACVATGLATRLGVSCSCGRNGPGSCEP